MGGKRGRVKTGKWDRVKAGKRGRVKDGLRVRKRRMVLDGEKAEG